MDLRNLEEDLLITRKGPVSILVKPGATRVKKSVRFAQDEALLSVNKSLLAPSADDSEVESGSLQEALILKRDADKLCQDMHSTSHVDNARAKDLYLQVIPRSFNMQCFEVLSERRESTDVIRYCLLRAVHLALKCDEY